MHVMRKVFVGLLLSICCLPAAYGQRAHRMKSFLQERQDANRIEEPAQGVTMRLNVPYLKDGDPMHRLDIYFPAKNDTAVPVLVHFHGGGWAMGDKKGMKATGLFYASRGVLFITPDYRLSPEVMHPAHVEDCAAALKWVFDHVRALGGNRHRIYLSGHSAGAHLAALLATNTKYLADYGLNPGDLAGVIPVDTASYNLVSNENERLVKRLVQRAFGTDPKVLRDASPFYGVEEKGKYPDFLVLNTTNRKSGVRGAREFVAKLESAGCHVRFVPVENHTHSEMARGMYSDTDPVGKAILKFILEG